MTIETANKKAVTATIDFSENATTSDAVDFERFTVCGLIFPETDQTTFTFLVSVDHTNFYPLKDKDDNDFTITKVAGETPAVYVEANVFAGFKSAKIVAGGNETADREIIFVLQEV